MLAACRERAEQARAAADSAAREAEAAAEAAIDVAPEAEALAEPEPAPAADEAAPSDDATGAARTYATVPLEEAMGTLDDFFDEAQTHRVLDGLRAILETEAPISLALVLRRVASLWDIARLTARVQQRVGDLMQTLQARFTGEGEQTFLWRSDQDPAAYDVYRRPARDGQGSRETSDLPPAEIANAARAILERSISVRRDELIKATARVFGITRAGRRVVEDVGRGLDLLVERGDARRQGELVILQERGGSLG